MPKIPSERISFCDVCGAEVAWGEELCPDCDVKRASETLPGRQAPLQDQVWEYRVVPFQGYVPGKVGNKVEAVGKQLEDLIAQMARKGWQFCGVQSVSMEIAPGCLAALLGRSADYARYDYVVFQRPGKS